MKHSTSRTIKQIDVAHYETGEVLAEPGAFTRWPKPGDIWQDPKDSTWYEISEVHRGTEPLVFVSPTMPPLQNVLEG